MDTNQKYWEKKIGFFLHDPIDKALGIRGHESRAEKIADSLGASVLKTEYQPADWTASGMDRAILPTYSENSAENGAIDFIQSPVITHPISAQAVLKVKFNNVSANDVTNQITDIINNDTGNEGDPWSRREYFYYLFFLLKNRLIEKNAGDLGNLWNHLPADTRIPDHSIWNHLALTSALGSSYELSPNSEASIVVYSLSPVQPFIAKTRKLRDHWTASVILSYLAFEGICEVMEILGPDHIIYPSLQGQPLIEEYLKKSSTKSFSQIVEDLSTHEQDSTVAAFPNKFVFIAPAGKETEYLDLISSRIDKKWDELCTFVNVLVKDKFESDAFSVIFDRQTKSYWQKNWGVCKLVGLDDKEFVKELYDDGKFNDLFEAVDRFSSNYNGYPIVYSVSHSLAQGALAVSKQQSKNQRADEPGEKCPVCGEFEILHNVENRDWNNAKEYSNAMTDFWNKLSEKFGESTVHTGEHLCSICTVKRFLPIAVKKYGKDHILSSVFNNADSFQTTTEMALFEFLQRNDLDPSQSELREIVEGIHNSDYKKEETFLSKLAKKVKDKNKKLNETDRYYAILIMDGDRMGDLVNGETVSAKWRDVLNPKLVKRYDTGILKANSDIWIGEEYLEKTRMLSPHLHADISEALGNFALNIVPTIVKKHGGRLIYAGGDDVAAVLPLSKALIVAKEIRNIYVTPFVKKENDSFVAVTEFNSKEKIFTLPGKGEGISISAGILIVHDKQPLRGALEEAHALLDEKAKKEAGRDAVALRLKKRSGQPRDLVCKWDALNPFAEGFTIMDSFNIISEFARDGYLSTSLIYNLSSLDEMLHGIYSASGNMDLSQKEKNRIEKVIAYEVRHSSGGNKIGETEGMKIARHIAGLILNYDDTNKKWNFTPEVPVIARYLGKGGK